MTHIQLTKLTRLPDRPDGQLMAWDRFGSIEVGYVIKGHYDSPPKIGEAFIVNRYERNGVKIDGEFSTSPVQLISRTDDGKTQIQTVNSIYVMENLP